ncbi:MAG: hypothetical protein J6Z36_05230 [Clostridia bacterium]|nr:hypothetical protein [Clostridia bacterium]
MERLSGIKLPVGASEEKLKDMAQKKLHAPLQYFRIVKKSLDARDKGKIVWLYTVEFSAQKQPVEDALAPCAEQVKTQPKGVLITGMGPAGLFCAVRLLQYGVTPIIIERGAPVEERTQDVENFFQSGKLLLSSNIQFGEGGAGTFSDGKLNTQTGGALNAEVLKLFAAFGAPQEIVYLNKPHVGSDKLKLVVENMRKYLLANGAKIYYHTALTDLEIKDGRVTGVTLSNGEKLPVSEAVLSIGHSARDTFEMLKRRGVSLEQKEFAVGVRVEHLQEKIGFAQYGKDYKLLPPADYKLTSHVFERAAFTFCMCPGGYVMAATSEEGGVVTNGMSNYARNGQNANSALIAQVKKEDFASDDPLAGVEFQRKLERAAYALGGGEYKAPAQRVEDFLQKRKSVGAGEVLPTYARGVTYTDLNGLFPQEITAAIGGAIADMDRRLKGFAHPDALMTGVESRTSSPVRITRDESGESVNVKGLYPCGEGAGYAGGITSAAADGLRTAERIARRYM